MRKAMLCQVSSIWKIGNGWSGDESDDDAGCGDGQVASAMESCPVRTKVDG